MSKHETLETATPVNLDFGPRLPVLITKYYVVLNVLNIIDQRGNTQEIESQQLKYLYIELVILASS